MARCLRSIALAATAARCAVYASVSVLLITSITAGWCSGTVSDGNAIGMQLSEDMNIFGYLTPAEFTAARKKAHFWCTKRTTDMASAPTLTTKHTTAPCAVLSD